MTSSDVARLARVLNKRLTGMQREGSLFESGKYKRKSATIFASFPSLPSLQVFVLNSSCVNLKILTINSICHLILA